MSVNRQESFLTYFCQTSDNLLHGETIWVMVSPCFLEKNRSSHQRCPVRKGVLRNFAKFTGKQLCKSLFFNKVAGLSPATLLKKRLLHRCFPVNFVKFLGISFLQNTSGRLLLKRTLSGNFLLMLKLQLE